MSRTVTVAATQTACDWDLQANIERAEQLVRRAAEQGAQIILLQELFETPYFCKDQKAEYFDLARPAEEHPVLERMSRLAAELEVVLPVSFFERAGKAFFNSLQVMDADGSRFPVYRKTHIPDGPGYQEKYYFSPGDTGFQVCRTRYAHLGTAICWDQWFPETARSMALQGAEILMFPTAIGSEPQDASIDSRDHWQRTMQGHAAANVMPLVASNRTGVEQGDACALTFYGSSFIADPGGEIVACAEREGEAVLTASFDLDAIARQRAAWGLFRDRRPEHYAALSSLDGKARV